MLEITERHCSRVPTIHAITSTTLTDITLQAPQTTSENSSHIMLMLVAAKLYELGRLSPNASTNLTGRLQTLFSSKIADYSAENFRLIEVKLAEELAKV